MTTDQPDAQVCAEIVREKIKVNAKKYPVEKAKGKSAKYDKL